MVTMTTDCSKTMVLSLPEVLCMKLKFIAFVNAQFIYNYVLIILKRLMTI